MATITLEDVNQNKLKIVNRCLEAISEVPLPLGTIPSEFPLGSDAQVASTIVDDTMVEVLNRGWWFNVDKNYELNQDSNGFISFPDTVLRIDSGRTQSYVKKNGMLYDTKNHSFEFTSSVKLDVVWVISYSDLPVAAYEYIATRAARKFQQRIIGSEEHNRFLLLEEEDALINLQRENAQYLDASLLEDSVSNRG